MDLRVIVVVDVDPGREVVLCDVVAVRVDLFAEVVVVVVDNVVVDGEATGLAVVTKRKKKIPDTFIRVI